ncbi:MAG: hypothetical protein MUP98_07850 [Candidatus Aminicenantes bacterium]|nr:hypothetical protein [Candidatus Aminicenantes bacterium]
MTIREIKIIDIFIGFFKSFFIKKQEKKKEETKLLYEAYEILKVLEQTWTVPSTIRTDLVDSTNLLLQKVQMIKRKTNKDMAKEIRGYAKRNCYAGALPISESKRIHEETECLRKKLREKLEIDEEDGLPVIID